MAGRGRFVPAHVLNFRGAQPSLLGSPLQAARIIDETPFLHRLPPPPQAPPPSIVALEGRLEEQYREIHGLLADNQHFAATHVALKQELEASHHELRVAGKAAARARAERQAEVREVLDRSIKAESEARGVEEMRAELAQVRSDVQKLGIARNELLERLLGLKGELSHAREELGLVSSIRAEIEVMSRELQRGRAAVDYEKKARAENLVQSKEMEKNMISLAHEVEKLRVELANAEKRARASAAAAVAANPSLGYPDAYRNSGMVYGESTYNAPYNLHQVQQGTTDSTSRYGQVGTAPTGYDTHMQNLVPR